MAIEMVFAFGISDFSQLRLLAGCCAPDDWDPIKTDAPSADLSSLPLLGKDFVPLPNEII